MQSLLTIATLLLGQCLSATALANRTHAPVVTNPHHALYQATLPIRQNTTIRGWITLLAPEKATGVKVHADFWGFPNNSSLEYYIHEDPVPSDGNCYRTGSPFDPYSRRASIPCNTTTPQACRIGDLSGKHGPIFTAADQGFEARYNDLYLSTEPGALAYFGNRSIVVHRVSDNARLSCANFTLVVRPEIPVVAVPVEKVSED
ncbi:putative cytosolic Cu/Zn superoxide dismutase [Aspergillus clavatus NRRL 1]|uniref:Cytosolic Cu/Zn superoxide dismutase, putative n=1 Tax=Aspergillus clavatus (strain ATCC 1007 / CBS 513.65 / DSM 816 / NCTC 3887 / NRRL 1 / QM 1276 / 107) TaxID=344612 RepID=A1CPW4_ASPCL|nr:cytosolic Cu/Zn superoxide dismutase, putative [Aspergillus clavatus NRRL 1]EAW07685.1 cytosolic Cu/Zn superoxide dismutase, putative [Aspergillus clavatus NRRL 1]